MASDSQDSDPHSFDRTIDDGNRHRHSRALEDNGASNSGADFGMEGSALDIAVFLLVSSCID